MRSHTLTALGSMLLAIAAASGCALTDAFFDALEAEFNGGAAATPSSSASESNSPPVASAGIDQRVTAGQRVVLSGLASTDADGDRIAYIWRQIGGPVDIALEDAFSSAPQFFAPDVTSETFLSFRLTVADGLATSSDDVLIVIEPANN